MANCERRADKNGKSPFETGRKADGSAKVTLYYIVQIYCIYTYTNTYILLSSRGTMFVGPIQRQRHANNSANSS